MKVAGREVPRLRALARRMFGKGTSQPAFTNSGDYWNRRYQRGGDSGIGSYGMFAEFKADILNAFVLEHGVRSVIEFGCGDGNQLSIARYPQYVGIDVSPQAIALCSRKFRRDPTKTFRTLEEYRGERADLALSLDVIFHLVENAVYEDYMARLFAAADRFVIIYSSNFNGPEEDRAAHVRHRRFSDWIDANAGHFSLLKHVPNRYPYAGDYRQGSFADFYIYQRTS